MLTQRHKMLDQLRAIPVAWLIVSAGLSLIVTLVFVLGSVSAQAAQPAMQAAGAWDIEQQAIVIAEVDVRNEATVALLQSLGYACAVGVCKLELPDGEELTLIERGLSVRIVGRAIKVAGSARAAAALEYEFGSNHTAVSIPDGATTCGPAVHSDIPLSAAPAGATVSYITPRLRIAHPYVGDLKVSLQNGGHTYDLWNRYGGTTDGDHDDDSEDDDDIELGSADWEVHTFDGDPVRQTWRLYAQDCAMGWTGNIDFWIIYVF